MRGRIGYFRDVLLAGRAPSVDRQKVFQLLRIYARIDNDIRHFQKLTGLSCLPGCGECCKNPRVESTVLEVLPMAVGLWRKKTAESWLQKLEAEDDSETCVFFSGGKYKTFQAGQFSLKHSEVIGTVPTSSEFKGKPGQPHTVPGSSGHCQVYAERPLICRLFGFSTITDKYGRSELVTCSLIKKNFASEFAEACRKISWGVPGPRMADFSRRTMMIDLALGQKKLPINVAVKQALERTGFLLALKTRK